MALWGSSASGDQYVHRAVFDALYEVQVAKGGLTYRLNKSPDYGELTAAEMRKVKAAHEALRKAEKLLQEASRDLSDIDLGYT